jgi:hypothetical protein
MHDFVFGDTPLECQTFNILHRIFLNTENNLLMEICETKAVANNNDTRERGTDGLILLGEQKHVA